MDTEDIRNHLKEKIACLKNYEQAYISQKATRLEWETWWISRERRVYKYLGIAYNVQRPWQSEKEARPNWAEMEAIAGYPDFNYRDILTFGEMYIKAKEQIETCKLLWNEKMAYYRGRGDLLEIQGSLLYEFLKERHDKTTETSEASSKLLNVVEDCTVESQTEECTQQNWENLKRQNMKLQEEIKILNAKVSDLTKKESKLEMEKQESKMATKILEKKLTAALKELKTAQEDLQQAQQESPSSEDSFESSPTDDSSELEGSAEQLKGKHQIQAMYKHLLSSQSTEESDSSLADKQRDIRRPTNRLQHRESRLQDNVETGISDIWFSSSSEVRDASMTLLEPVQDTVVQNGTAIITELDQQRASVEVLKQQVLIQTSKASEVMELRLELKNERKLREILKTQNREVEKEWMKRMDVWINEKAQLLRRVAEMQKENADLKAAHLDEREKETEDRKKTEERKERAGSGEHERNKQDQPSERKGPGIETQRPREEHEPDGRKNIEKNQAQPSGQLQHNEVAGKKTSCSTLISELSQKVTELEIKREQEKKLKAVEDKNAGWFSWLFKRKTST